jgi:Divergent InlB B-repeat domain
MSRVWRRGRILLTLSLSVSALFGLAAPAMAVTTSHSLLYVFYASWEKEENPRFPPHRSFPPPEEAGFEDACGIAVDPAGLVYVSDYYHDAVDVFERRSGNLEYIAQIASEDPGNGPCGLAVDATGNVYVNNWRGSVVKYTPSAYPPTKTSHWVGTMIDPGRSTGVALDPTTGNVFVDDQTYVAEYEPSGAPVESAGVPVRIGLGSLGSGFGVGVSGFPATAGYVYVADASDGTVKAYDPATDLSNPVAVIDGAGTPQAGFDSMADSSVAVDPTDGNVFVVDNLGTPFVHPEAVVDEFTLSGAFRSQISGPLGFGRQSGLYLDSGNVYVTSGSTEFSAMYAFGPAVPGAELQVAKAGSGEGSIRSEPAGIACGSACAAEYNRAQSVSLTARPDPHSRLAGWSGCDSEPGPGECRVSMTAARSVTAEFVAIPQQQLTLSAAGPGEATSDPAGLTCREATCGEHFDEDGPGSVVTLTALPDPHSRLAGWSGCDSEPGPGECRVSMAAARSVTASFGPLLRTVAISIGGAGTGSVVSAPAGVDCRGSCTAGFLDGTSVTFTAVPAPGSIFTGWGGSCTGISLCRRTAASDIALLASFAPIPREGPPVAPAAELSLGKVVRGSSPLILRLPVTNSVPGSLVATGRGLKKVTLKEVQSGTNVLELALDQGGKQLLKSATPTRLSIPVKVTLKPSSAAPLVRTKRVTFRLVGSRRSGPGQKAGGR